MSDNKRMNKAAVQAVVGLALTLVLIGCSVPEAAVYADRGQDTEDPGSGSRGRCRGHRSPGGRSHGVPTHGRWSRSATTCSSKGWTNWVSDRLMELEAKKRGISVDELIAREVEAKVPEPTDEEVDAFYAERKDRIQQPQEEVAGQIREYLVRQRQGQVHAKLVADLKADYGYQLMLEPIRVVVVAEGFPAKGPASAPVTIVEFSDFECPYCARVNPALEQVVKNYGDQVRLVFRQFPLNIHPNAQKAAEASLCAPGAGQVLGRCTMPCSRSSAVWVGIS